MNDSCEIAYNKILTSTLLLILSLKLSFFILVGGFAMWLDEENKSIENNRVYMAGKKKKKKNLKPNDNPIFTSRDISLSHSIFGHIENFMKPIKD